MALTEDPGRVVEAHRNFIDAGAQIITTIKLHRRMDSMSGESASLRSLMRVATPGEFGSSRSTPPCKAGVS